MRRIAFVFSVIVTVTAAGCNGDKKKPAPDADADGIDVAPDPDADIMTEMDTAPEAGDPAQEDTDRAEDIAGEDIPGDTIEPAVPILADYNSELREAEAREDGIRHVDSPLLVERLVELGANTYAFLIYHQTTDWDDLHEYLPLAEAAGLKTWVYLVPPSELPSQYPPYEDDYVAWAGAIGELAASWPSLTAFAMDDFNSNLDTFTVSTTCDMIDAARSSRPDIKFYPVDYYRSVLGDIGLNDYTGCVDGIIFPYWDLDSTAEMRSQIEDIATLRLGGMRIGFSFPASTPSSAGDYVRYSLACAPELPTATVAFRYTDSFGGPTADYHFTRILVDGETVWSEDVEGSEPMGPYSLEFATGSGVDLAFELYDRQGVGNFGITVAFSSVEITGCGDAGPDAWSMDSNNPDFSASISEGIFYPGLEIIPMIYAHRTSWHPDPPTTEYIAGGVSIALETWQDGIAQGVITYCLEKEPATHPDYVAVQEIYNSY